MIILNDIHVAIQALKQSFSTEQFGKISATAESDPAYLPFFHHESFVYELICICLKLLRL